MLNKINTKKYYSQQTKFNNLGAIYTYYCLNLNLKALKFKNNTTTKVLTKYSKIK